MAGAEFGLEHLLFQAYGVEAGRFNGEAVRPFCYGPGKVVVAERWARDNDVDLGQSTFYSDSYTDLPMLARVGHPRLVAPDLRLAREARARAWPVLDWSGTESS
jgi:phosphoserine phosphatase